MKALGTCVLALIASVACSAEIGRTDDPFGDSEAPPTARAAAMPGTYKLVRRGSGKCLDVDANSNSDGANIHQWECNGTGAQSFRFEEISTGVYQIIKAGTNKCVDIASGGRTNGTNVQLWSCNRTSAQQFQIQDRGDGTSRLRNPASGKCVDVNGASSANGANVQLWSCSSSDAQRWTITRVGDDGGGDDGGGDDGGGDDGGDDGGLVWRAANLTWFTSYPDPDSEECREYNGCTWAGYFAFVDGRQTEQWVRDHNILAVHSRDASRYALKTLRLRQNGRQIDATVYDMCSDSDCSGCCTRNASETGFLIDIESYTRDRFGSGDGIVEWACLDCN